MIDLALLTTANLDSKLLIDLGVGEGGQIAISDPRVRHIRREGTLEALIRASIGLGRALLATMQSGRGQRADYQKTI